MLFTNEITEAQIWEQSHESASAMQADLKAISQLGREGNPTTTTPNKHVAGKASLPHLPQHKPCSSPRPAAGEAAPSLPSLLVQVSALSLQVALNAKESKVEAPSRI